jgi:hypothetical protein
MDSTVPCGVNQWTVILKVVDPKALNTFQQLVFVPEQHSNTADTHGNFELLRSEVRLPCPNISLVVKGRRGHVETVYSACSRERRDFNGVNFSEGDEYRENEEGVDICHRDTAVVVSEDLECGRVVEELRQKRILELVGTGRQGEVAEGSNEPARFREGVNEIDRLSRVTVITRCI